MQADAVTATASTAPICPRCGDPRVVPGRSSTALLSALGALAGGLHGWLSRSAAIATGAQVGRLLGSIAGPAGQTAGVAGGAMIGALIGAATGLALGNSLGQLVDQNILGRYRCLRCGHRFTPAMPADESPADRYWPPVPPEAALDPDALGA
jgi:rRNA maturation protein Nop10